MNAPLGPNVSRRPCSAAAAPSSSASPCSARCRRLPQDGPRISRSCREAASTSFPMLDSWIRIDADGRVTVFTGKAELGQGIKTALIQVAAEELRVDPATISSSPPTPGRRPTRATPPPAIRWRTAAPRSSMRPPRSAPSSSAWPPRSSASAATQLKAENGAVVTGDGRKASLWRTGRRPTCCTCGPRRRRTCALRRTYTVIGKSMPRVDIPAKVTRRRRLCAGPAPGGHGARPRRAAAELRRPPASSSTPPTSRRLPGVIKVVRDGSFLAVVAEREFQAIQRA